MKDRVITRQGKVVGEILLDRFCKFAINERRHLLWSKGGVPCIDAVAWDEYKEHIKEIYVRTDKGRRFKVSTEVFEANKQTLDYGFGKQYWIDRKLWEISGEMASDEIKTPINTEVNEVIPSQSKLL